MSSKKVIHFFYDLISPYSFLGFESMTRHVSFWESKVDLVLRPFRLGIVMKAAGNRPPAMVPAKGLYLMKDYARGAKFRGIPSTIPPRFMEYITMAEAQKKMMLFLASTHNTTNGTATETLTRVMYKTIFCKHVPIDQLNFEELGKEAGLDGSIVAQCIKDMDDPKSKELLDANTKMAIDWGAFGAPTMVYDAPTGPELYFGSDRVEVLCNELGLKYGGSLTKLSKL